MGTLRIHCINRIIIIIVTRILLLFLPIIIMIHIEFPENRITLKDLLLRNLKFSDSDYKYYSFSTTDTI